MPEIEGIRIPDKPLTYQQVIGNASADDIATKDCWITRVRVSNPTAGALTVTLKDKRGTPLNHYGGVSIAANSVSNERIEPPLKCVGGADIQASGAGLVGDIAGFVID